jgi:hypothetical protein
MPTHIGSIHLLIMKIIMTLKYKIITGIAAIATIGIIVKALKKKKEKKEA